MLRISRCVFYHISHTPFGRSHRLGLPTVVCVECLPADKPWDVVSVTCRSSGVAPRVCVRVYARVLVPPNLYIHTNIPSLIDFENGISICSGSGVKNLRSEGEAGTLACYSPITYIYMSLSSITDGLSYTIKVNVRGHEHTITDGL